MLDMDVAVEARDSNGACSDICGAGIGETGGEVGSPCQTCNTAPNATDNIVVQLSEHR